jgi:sulfate transport system permease protein
VKGRSAANDPKPLRWGLTLAALLFLGVFVALPLMTVFGQALGNGLGAYWDAIRDPDALSAIRLTIVITVGAVVLNTVFGAAAAWALAKFRFRGRSVLLTLIDLPFAVSPVVAGLIFLLVFGRRGWLGPWLYNHDIRVVFAWPGILIATVFVTFPLVARQLIPLMESQGSDEEEAGLALGAGGWRVFFRITLPNIKWALLYGVILCSARAMGEFGAVSVLSGHIRGETDTMPLHVEAAYNDYNFTAAFAVASLLAGLALATLAVKSLLEWKIRGEHSGRSAAAEAET